MVDYLTSLGHKYIGCLSGLNYVHASKHRLKGCQNALKKANIAFDSDLIIDGDFSSTCGIKAAKLFADMPKRPTAIFSMSDKMAIGLIQGFKKLGLKVPEDISVSALTTLSLQSSAILRLQQFANQQKNLALRQ